MFVLFVRSLLHITVCSVRESYLITDAELLLKILVRIKNDHV